MGPGLRRRVGVALSVVLAVGALGVVSAAPASAAEPCRAQLFRAGVGLVKEYANFQTAINNAKIWDDTIKLSGTCVGNFRIDGPADIDIVPIPVTAGVKPPPPILRAPASGGRVVFVPVGVVVRMKGLTIRGGNVLSATGLEAWGGGISNWGGLVLTDVVVRGNKAVRGGGISNSGVLRTFGETRIHDNTATDAGGGVDTQAIYRATAWASFNDDTRVDHNHAVTGGGVNINASKLVMNDNARIDDNTADYGGGIASNSTASKIGTLVMKNASEVDSNTAGLYGAAMSVQGNNTLMDDAWVHDNDISGVDKGGVVEVYSYGPAVSLTLTEGATISDNLGGTGGGGVVSWQDCGATPTLSGLGPRVVDNTPANVVLRTGAEDC